jgi:hypothetical protein
MAAVDDSPWEAVIVDYCIILREWFNPQMAGFGRRDLAGHSIRPRKSPCT